MSAVMDVFGWISVVVFVGACFAWFDELRRRDWEGATLTLVIMLSCGLVLVATTNIHQTERIQALEAQLAPPAPESEP